MSRPPLTYGYFPWRGSAAESLLQNGMYGFEAQRSRAMHRLIHSNPEYRKHRAPGQAIVTVDGKDR